MSKPEDIPQDVWDYAIGVVDDYDMLLEGRAFAAVVLRIARTIMAAKAEEREACVLEADKATRFNRGIAAQRACYRIAAAIRKRGEA